MLSKYWVIFPDKSKWVELMIYFSGKKNNKNKQTNKKKQKKKTGIFKAFTPGNSEKLCVAPLENSKVKNEDP